MGRFSKEFHYRNCPICGAFTQRVLQQREPNPLLHSCAHPPRHCLSQKLALKVLWLRFPTRAERLDSPKASCSRTSTWWPTFFNCSARVVRHSNRKTIFFAFCRSITSTD